MDGTECVETKIPAVFDVLAPSVRFPEENAFSACGLRGAPFQRLRLAVLIDGDNQAPAPVENFLKKLPAYGNVTMGRVFRKLVQTRLRGVVGLFVAVPASVPVSSTTTSLARTPPTSRS